MVYYLAEDSRNGILKTSMRTFKKKQTLIDYVNDSYIYKNSKWYPKEENYAIDLVLYVFNSDGEAPKKVNIINSLFA